MKYHHLFIGIACCLAFAVSASAETRVADWMRFNGVMSSIAANDYKAFCTQGKELSTNVPKKEFQELVTFLRPILLNGYNATVTGYTEKDLEHIFITWSLYYKSGEPNVIVRLDFSGPGAGVTDVSVE